MVQFGSDTSEESMAALTAEFNEIVAASEYKVKCLGLYLIRNGLI